MIRILAVASLLSLLAARAPQELKLDVLEKLKSATVYVKTPDGTGSGFLFLKRATTGYIMTCEHVVGRAENVKVVFWSGTPQEKTHNARVVATDPSRDIACLIVRDFAGLPAVLDLGRKTEVKETETVFAAGFPFGEMLAAGSRNPEISISKSSVTSIRRGDQREVVAVQISGDVNPGNSGGPLIGTDGRVIGVTAAKIIGTQTAFAVPPEEIQGFLKGRVKASTFRRVGVEGNKARYEVILDLVDPLVTLKGAGIAYVNEDAIKGEIEPEKDGTWKKAHASMKSVDFPIDEDRAVKTLEFIRDGADSFSIVFQCFHVRGDGVRVWTGPASQEISFGAEGRRPPRRKDPPSQPPSKPPPKDDPPDPPAPEPPAGPVVELLPPDKASYIAELKPAAAYGGLCLAPDGSALYALDLSEGQVCKLDPESLAIKERVDILASSVSMTMSPDGKNLFVGGRYGRVRQDHRDKEGPGGSIEVIATSTFKVIQKLDLKTGIMELVATDQGLIAATTNSHFGLTIIDPGQKTETEVRTASGGGFIRLYRDQRRVYTGDVGVIPADFRCTPFRRESGQYQPYDSPYHGDHPLGGYFELAPDGRFLVAGTGSILRLGRARDADLRFVSKIEPFQTAVMGAGCSILFATSPEGFLKSYTLGTFELRKAVELGFRCERGVLDVKRKRLIGVFGDVPDKTPRFGSPQAAQLRVGWIGALPLEGK